MERNTDKRSGAVLAVPVAAGAIIEAGKLICVNAAGFAVPGSAVDTLTALGRAAKTVDNSAGADGAAVVEVERGVFKYANSPSDAVSQAEFGKTIYVEDAETLCKTALGKSIAGKCLGIEGDGVWVEIR